MFKKIKRTYHEIRNLRSFAALAISQKRIVFYSEGSASFVHFEAIITSLWKVHHQPIIYLTSDEQESIKLFAREGITVFYIGSSFVRTILFAFLDTQIMVMTMPDLQTYHIKRSYKPVHYVYVHHSMVSCHMIYHAAAFDHFNTIFCVGPHHIEEIKAREKEANLPEKNLVSHGYGRLDKLIQLSTPDDQSGLSDGFICVLIAPSWGKNSLLEKHGEGFIKRLLEKGIQVVLRPHPQTQRMNGHSLDLIQKNLSVFPNFYFEKDIASTQTLQKADLMISDWSGAALEFAFSKLKPVIFVDVPKKINNSTYESLHIEPLEVSIRNQIGVIVPENRILEIDEYIFDLIKNYSGFRDRIKACREKYVYNLEKSGNAGALALMNILSTKNAGDQ